MGAIAKALASPARPIAIAEFVDALFTIWRPPFYCSGGRSSRLGKYQAFFGTMDLEIIVTGAYSELGLAISGGVDSMALAVLCSRTLHRPLRSLSHAQDRNIYRLDTTTPNLEFHAFVVDHGVRPGSNVEAKAVSRLLRQRGMLFRYSSILFY
jgi:hypothetical protein